MMACASRSPARSCILLWNVVLPLIAALALALSPALVNAGDSDALGLARTIVDDYRRIIVLMSEPQLPEVDAERARMVGRLLFFRNHARREALTQLAGSEPATTGRFLDWLEHDTDLRDADKLAFLEMLFDLEQQLLEKPASFTPAVAARIREDIALMRQIESRYAEEVRALLARLNTRAMQLKRESWDSYLQFVRSRFASHAILREFAQTPLEEPSMRGARNQANRLELNGSALPARTLVLTFDDGPHGRYTDRILDILQQEGLPAIFFEVGHNIGNVAEDGTVKLTRAAKATRRILEMGHTLGNHSFSHPVLPSLPEAQIATEIEQTNQMLEAATEQTPLLFRAPYGARNQGILNALQARNLKSIMWNIDSEDWADPIPESIAARVVSEVEKLKHGIVLFHDIHQRTVAALPLVIKSLKEAGYQFAGWDRTRFQVAAGAPAVRGTPTAARAPTASPYRESWAVVIGIDDYAKWPKLRYAVHDAESIRDVLLERYQFKPENVFLLRNREATRENILSLLGDKLANAELVKRDDRVFVFFAGHGATRRLPSGRELGYIIPAEADLQNFQGQAISMTNFQDISEAIPAKHVLFVMDSCYSGLALTRGVTPSTGQNFLAEISRRPARQMLTAGGGDQQVADGGPNGHSVFTWTLMQALEGNGDLNGDGVITGAELGAYVGPIVSSLAMQTPAFGSMPGSQGGEFVFELKPESEFLSSQSQELDQEAVRLNTEIAKLRAAITAKAERNRKLKQELGAAQSTLANGETAVATRAASPRESASTHNDRGTALFREKKYAQAALAFQAAVELDPDSALAANNLGFAHYKLGTHALAVEWFEKTVRIDPQRAIAYYNLGDAYFELNRLEDARKSYETFLALQPNAKAAPQARERLRSLAAQ
jgi:peptidoglycan/xylan/chitin deacetylase (PgdA/CDA1 family)/uncharacterized caspase-like protein